MVRYIGTENVLLGARNATYVNVSDTKGRIVDPKNKFSRSITNTKSVALDYANTRKFVNVKILKRNVKFQLDFGSDLTILNLHTWRKLSKPTMLKSNKIASCRKNKFRGRINYRRNIHGKNAKTKIICSEEQIIYSALTE